MKQILLLPFLAILMFSCNSPSDKSNHSAYVYVNKFHIAWGADSLLMSYNYLFSGTSCYDSADKSGVAVMTMQVSSYSTAKPDDDTPITFESFFKNDTLRTQWEYKKPRLAELGNCLPAVVYFPLDTVANPNCDNDGYLLWFVKAKDYQKYADTCNPDSLRNCYTIIRHLPVIAAHDIKKITLVDMESDTGYWAKKLPDSTGYGYKNLYSSTGVIVNLLTKLDSRHPTECYIISNYDQATVRWKGVSVE
jgi:hypothetical protein